MARMTEPAYNMDENFRATIAAAGVTVVDQSGAPEDVVFEGPRSALEQLLRTEWDYRDADLSTAIGFIEGE